MKLMTKSSGLLKIKALVDWGQHNANDHGTFAVFVIRQKPIVSTFDGQTNRRVGGFRAWYVFTLQLGICHAIDDSLLILCSTLLVAHGQGVFLRKTPVRKIGRF